MLSLGRRKDNSINTCLGQKILTVDEPSFINWRRFYIESDIHSGEESDEDSNKESDSSSDSSPDST